MLVKELLIFTLWYGVITWVILRGMHFHQAAVTRMRFLLAFNLKFAVAFVFGSLSTHVLGTGELTMDASAFFYEAQVLHRVVFQDPLVYLKLLTGIGENEELVRAYISETLHWSGGDLTLLNDGKNVIRVHSVLLFFSGHVQAVHWLFSSFITSFGLLKLVNAFSRYTSASTNNLFLVLMLYPNLLLWTGDILKEPFVVLGLGICVERLLFFQTVRNNWWMLSLGLTLLIAFKTYIFIVLFTSVIVVLVLWMFSRNLWKSFSIGIVLVVSVLLVYDRHDQFIAYFSERQLDFINVGRGGVFVHGEDATYRIETKDSANYELSYYIEQFGVRTIRRDTGINVLSSISCEVIRFGDKLFYQRGELKPGNYHVIENMTAGRSYFDIPLIKYSYKNLILYTPNAIVNALFRPFPFDNGGVMKYFAILESLTIFFLLGFALFHRRTLNQRERFVVCTLIVFILGLSALIGHTVPVSGAIVRYRIPVYLAILILSWMIIDPKKIQHRLWKKLF